MELWILLEQVLEAVNFNRRRQVSTAEGWYELEQTIGTTETSQWVWPGELLDLFWLGHMVEACGLIVKNAGVAIIFRVAGKALIPTRISIGRRSARVHTEALHYLCRVVA